MGRVDEGRGQPLPHRRVSHRKQQRAGATRLFHQRLHVVRRHGPTAHTASICPPGVDRAELDGVGGVARAGPYRDGREVAVVLTVGHAAHLHRHSGGRERYYQVVQDGAAAENQVATIRVGRDQVPVPVGVQLHRVGTDPPAPRLGVVHGRCAQRVLDRRREVRGPAHGGLQVRCPYRATGVGGAADVVLEIARFVAGLARR